MINLYMIFKIDFSTKFICRVFLVILITFTFNSCQQRKNKTLDLNYALAQIQADTFIRQIPILENGDPRRVYYNLREIEKDFKLNPIETGVDSIEIRFWFGYNLIDTLQCLRIYNTKKEWKGELITTSYIQNDKKALPWITTTQVKSKVPKSGWTFLINEIVKLGVITLPDANNIPDYAFATHSRSLIIEISTSKFYRLYSYDEPFYNSKKIQEAKYIEDIIHVLQDELQFKMLQKF